MHKDALGYDSYVYRRYLYVCFVYEVLSRPHVTLLVSFPNIAPGDGLPQRGVRRVRGELVVSTMFPGSALCSPVPMLPGTDVPRTYVPQYL